LSWAKAGAASDAMIAVANRKRIDSSPRFAAKIAQRTFVSKRKITIFSTQEPRLRRDRWSANGGFFDEKAPHCQCRALRRLFFHGLWPQRRHGWHRHAPFRGDGWGRRHPSRHARYQFSRHS